ncbi:Aste57867_9810 [Aphanomyces stellatus]|uniref:Aste57867_9810 protein n=1 Tax=Aphanomyces stellatus TaxID=120398 RepID=A0A485KPE2_9STRA|nr:hypothetical protein As57867_009771 [Aphanomyces stellatus]VFT86689.1 Aste57867_9810 [Aphanomyces stellatus]
MTVFQDLPDSARLDYLPPSAHLDDAVYSVYSEDENMRFIPFLCRMAPDDWAARRNTHRAQMINGEGAFFDIVERSSGAVIGTSGFRTIDLAAGVCEWGIVLNTASQGRGYCKEVHDACMRWAAAQGLTKSTAATWESNARMNELLVRYGWRYTETRTNDYGVWREYVFDIVQQ